MSGSETRITLVLAFDHELSLGGTDSYAQNLFEPTEALFECAEAARVPIVLFTDVLSAIKYSEWGVREFVDPYETQLRSALRRGHDVQLHLHPHWLDSTWSDGSVAPSRSFSLADFADQRPPLDIASIVGRGTQYLIDTCAPEQPEYAPVAFRAGGYNIAPHTAEIFAALRANGIRIDSSIIPGFYFESEISTIDFRSVPRRPTWDEHGLLEIPIASSPRTPLNNFPFLLRRVRYRDRAPASHGKSIHDERTSKMQKLARLVPRSAWPLSFDNYADDAKHVFKVFRGHVARHRNEAEILCASVSHPKSMGAHARRVLVEFVEQARDAYGDRLHFETFASIAKRLDGTDSERPRAVKHEAAYRS